MMKLYYDNIIFHLQRAGGISTYWAELIAHAQKDKLYIKFIDGENENISAQTLTIKPEDIRENISKPIIFKRFNQVKLGDEKTDFIFHSSYNRVCLNKNAKNVITIHDFVHEKFYGGLRKLLHSSQKTRALNVAERIITVSENTKNDLLKLHPNIDPAKVEVIYNGVSADFYNTNASNTVDKPFLLYIGSREHYKNFNFVVQLVKEMPEFDLYVVGSKFSKHEKSLLTQLSGRFKLFFNIDNTELNKLYNSAFALLYPSSYEGFGIPLLEAMKTGLPFIALNKSSIPEVAGNAGELIDELDIDGFQQAIHRIENSREDYVAKGLKRAEMFSWDKCYGQTIELYSKLV